MKRTNIIILAIIAVLLIVSSIIYLTRNIEPQKTLRDFAVEDTSSITKIFLANRTGSAVILERKEDGNWTVNEKYPARHDFINNLLTTIKKIEVSAPVAKTKMERVMKDLSVQGIKVQIYQNNELTKTYYVGGITEDNNGTYMILEGSDLPFILSRPGFTGYLTVHYLPELAEWRERIAFNYKVEDISKVYVQYADYPEESFIATRMGNNRYSLTNIDGSNVDFPIDTLRVKEYVSRIKFIGFESYLLDSLQDFKRDSLLNTKMLASFTIEDLKGQKNEFKTYRRQNISGQFDQNGVPYEYDVDNLYGILNNKDVVIMQYPIIDPICFVKSDFKSNRQTGNAKK